MENNIQILQTYKIQKLSKPSKHQAVKNLKNVNKEATLVNVNISAKNCRFIHT